jgi:hypothetical protein
VGLHRKENVLVQGLLLAGLVPAMIVFGVWYLRGMRRWIGFLKEAGATAGSMAERKAVISSLEYREIRRAVRLPLNLVAGCALILYLVLRSM